MRIGQVKEAIKRLFDADLVPGLVGERGVGKSEVLRQFAEERGWGYFDLYASGMEGPDFMGLQVRDEKRGLSRYLPPEVLPTVQAVEAGVFPEKGLLVIEELNRAEAQTINALYPLLLYRRINNHRLAPGWKLAVTMNPDNNVYMVNQLDPAARERFDLIEVETNYDDYADYSISSGKYHPPVLAFLATDKSMLLQKAEVADVMQAFPSPRQWTKVQRLFQAGAPEDNLTLELVSGMVGAPAAAALFGFLKNKDMMPIPWQDAIAAKPQAILALRRLLEAGRYDVVMITLRELVAHATIKRAETMEKFLLELPRELQLAFCRILLDKRHSEFVPFLRAMRSLYEEANDLLTELLPHMSR